VLVLIAFVLVALVLFGVAFTIQWLFIAALIGALLFMIISATRGTQGSNRSAWW
jgi:hypothetical protein